MIEVLTTFGKLDRGDRVRLPYETEVRKVIAAVPDDERPMQLFLSFGAAPRSVPKRGLVWQVFPRG